MVNNGVLAKRYFKNIVNNLVLAKWRRSFSKKCPKNHQKVNLRPHLVLQGRPGGSREENSCKKQKNRSKNMASTPSCFSMTVEMECAVRVRKLAGIPSPFSF
jgi:hypothetical protein